MANRGQDLLALFSRTGCLQSNDSLTGEDFDWIFETSDPATVEFLDWACKNIHRENVLTEAEVQEWEDLKMRSPEAILSGQRLEEALNVLKSSDETTEADLDDKDVLQRRTMLAREELDVMQMSVHDLKHVQRNLNAARSKLSLLLGQMDSRKEDMNKELVVKQHKLIQVNEDLRASINNLSSNLKVVSDILDEQQGKLAPRFISETDLDPIFREVEKVLTLIRDHIQERIGDDSSRCIGDRHPQEFEQLVSEIERIRFSFADMEKQRLYHEMELAGVKAGCMELEKQIQLLRQDKLQDDPLYLENTISKMETNLSEHQRKIITLHEDVLPDLIAKNVDLRCKNILSADITAKLQRQTRALSDMEFILDFLAELIACQQSLGSVFQQELGKIHSLEKILQSVSTLQEGLQAHHSKRMAMFENAKEQKRQNSRQTLQASDEVAIAIHKLVEKEKVFDSSLITLSDVQRSVKNLKEESERLSLSLSRTDSEIEVEKNQLLATIHKLQSDLHIEGDASGSSLTPAEVSARMQQSVTEVRHYEGAIKSVVDAWDRASRSLKDNPALSIERQIWKDYFNQPEFLEQTIKSTK